MDDRLMLHVSLWLRENDVAAFEAFEQKAAQAMAHYGGRIEQAIRVAPNPQQEDQPFEIHLMSFPDAASFAAYRHGPEAAALAAERERLIARTVVTAYEND